ncbi:MAG: response regulator [Acidobacteria bacterium]|nr:response regulator [Acidobacteriota bacterium]
MRILVVDDEENVCKTIALMLTRMGHTCETASGGEEALKMVGEASFNAVLTDLGMPGMNGLEVAERIKRIAPEVRIILVTGWPIQLSLEQLNQCGIERVVDKPIKLKDLLSALHAPRPE